MPLYDENEKLTDEGEEVWDSASIAIRALFDKHKGHNPRLLFSLFTNVVQRQMVNALDDLRFERREAQQRAERQARLQALPEPEDVVNVVMEDDA